MRNPVSTGRGREKRREPRVRAVIN